MTLSTDAAAGAIHYTWKGDPYSSHTIALRWLSQAPASSRILDVGCADGALASYLQRDKALLTGIEPHPEWARRAEAHYGTVINGLLSDVAGEVFQSQDIVLFLDSLEHMADPAAELSRLTAQLPPHGQVIISVPNVAHLYIRLMLLLGKFEYTEKGILDRTHLRFFTARTLREMVEGCGLVIEKQTATPVPLPLVHPFFAKTKVGRAVHRLSAAAARLMPALLGYQLLIMAKRYEQ